MTHDHLVVKVKGMEANFLLLSQRLQKILKYGRCLYSNNNTVLVSVFSCISLLCLHHYCQCCMQVIYVNMYQTMFTLLLPLDNLLPRGNVVFASLHFTFLYE